MGRVSERMMQLELLRVEVDGSEFVGMVQRGDGVGKVETGRVRDGGRGRFGHGRVAGRLGLGLGARAGGFGVGVSRFAALAGSVEGTERSGESGTGGGGGGGGGSVLFSFGQRESRPDPAPCVWSGRGDVRERGGGRM